MFFFSYLFAQNFSHLQLCQNVSNVILLVGGNGIDIFNLANIYLEKIHTIKDLL